MLFFIIGLSVIALIGPTIEAVSEFKKSKPGKKLKNAFAGATTLIVAESLIFGIVAVMAMSM